MTRCFTVCVLGKLRADIPQGWLPVTDPRLADAIFVAHDRIPPDPLPLGVQVLITHMSAPPWEPANIRTITPADVPAEVMLEVTPAAEHAWGLIHAAHRKLSLAFDDPWGNRDDHMAPRMLSRMSLGVIGTGRIGYRVAKIGHAWGMEVHTCDLEGPPQHARTCDIVVICTSRTACDPVVDGDSIAGMADGAILVGIAHAGAYDAEAVMAALMVGKLSCAAFDCFPMLPPPLRSWANVLRQSGSLIITPHIGGSTKDARRAVEEAVLEAAWGYLALLQPVRSAVQ